MWERTCPPVRSAANRLSKIVGYPGEQNGAVYKITVGRADPDVREHGARIDARMGLNTWAAFTGSDAEAVVAGDVAMHAAEVTPVLKALRGAGLQVVSIHHHMTTGSPHLYFLHYWGRGSAADAGGRSARRAGRATQAIERRGCSQWTWHLSDKATKEDVLPSLKCLWSAQRWGYSDLD